MKEPCQESLLTKSHVYAIVRECVNFKKHNFDTENVLAHVEDSNFSVISEFINANADRIFIRQPQLDIPITPHRERLSYIFNLPKNLELEYLYCEQRYNGSKNGNCS
ncbi:lef-11 [Agrotis segetum granulovirus]|uniref:Late expression factor 11 n=1 Tax=Agrotis segetum granulosis virus TaxID=10464 RepID=A0A023MI73_GVAS|nr:lef-11 [Agrotis segetum granulovirus]AHN92100.1 lef-11 [Agrotis segetum granulovirus]AKN63335.1 lef-11 [Agrotis segetum granulovirus]